MNIIQFPTHNPNVYLNVRPDRKDDLDVVREIWCEDVYHVRDKVENAKLVVDVGANIGVFTAYCLEYGSECEVMAIEPEPNNFEILEQNISRVDPNRVTLSKFAVSNYVGRSTIEDNSGSSVLGRPGASVNVTKIDNILSNWHEGEDIDIFKIDIEGSEVDVMMDMSEELQKRIVYFAIEFDHDSKGFGKVIEKLSETHHVTTLGAASRGAMIFAERY